MHYSSIKYYDKWYLRDWLLGHVMIWLWCIHHLGNNHVSSCMDNCKNCFFDLEQTKMEYLPKQQQETLKSKPMIRAAETFWIIQAKCIIWLSSKLPVFLTCHMNCYFHSTGASKQMAIFFFTSKWNKFPRIVSCAGSWKRFAKQFHWIKIKHSMLLCCLGHNKIC